MCLQKAFDLVEFPVVLKRLFDVGVTLKHGPCDGTRTVTPGQPTPLLLVVGCDRVSCSLVMWTCCYLNYSHTPLEHQSTTCTLAVSCMPVTFVH